MKLFIFLFAIILASICPGQTYTLEIRAAIDGEPGYCDSLLSLAGAAPGAGTHHIPAGDSVTVTIDTSLVEVAIGTRDSCFGWTSIASTLDSTHGHGSSLSIVITENTTVIWNFKRQFTFEVDCEAYGSFFEYDSPTPSYGIHWFDALDSITASVAIFVDSATYRIYCLGYSGTGSVDTWGHSNSWTGTLEEPSSIKWTIDVVHPVCSLLVISEHGEGVPPSGHWNYMPRHSEVTLAISAVDSSDIGLGVLYNCIGWRGEGCVPDSGPVPYVPPYNVCAVVCSTEYGIIEWLWDTVSTGIEENPAKPGAFEISTYPNPFNSAVWITIDDVGAHGCAPSRVEIFDVNGRRIDVIARPEAAAISPYKGDCFVGQSPSRNDGASFVWRPDESLPSGVYLVRAAIEGGGIERATAKIIYLK